MQEMTSLVEDDVAFNKDITLKLKKEGYHVLGASNIKEARSSFQSNSVDLIVSDIGLPDGSGFDFCQEVRQISGLVLLFFQPVQVICKKLKGVLSLEEFVGTFFVILSISDLHSPQNV
ncbi:hypothetical protein CSE16_17370 [Solibacillus sp. R5-41]|uniref:response regulator n=1 Tax=Solibacillus sp. R5-41 TaxID=2048654 RepID=UPI000C124F81|nr:response regulator [Solibacillus sp. R5-41]ATP41660.1 hypothetical protein CSE16_17370 [Solibacillus sp. R5-41]